MSNAIEDYVKSLGGEVSFTKVGHSWVHQNLIEMRADIAGELSAHYYFAYNYFGFDDEHPDYKSLRPEYVVEASELYEQFHNTPEQSHYRYGGKMIQITGEITSIEKVDSLTIAVYVFNEGDFGNEGIRCIFLIGEGDLINEIKDIEGASIKGLCSGFNDSDVIIEKCSLIK